MGGEIDTNLYLILPTFAFNQLFLGVREPLKRSLILSLYFYICLGELKKELFFPFLNSLRDVMEFIQKKKKKKRIVAIFFF